MTPKIYTDKSYGKIIFSGVDAEKFLQTAITKNMSKVTEQTPSFAAYCTKKGKAIALFKIFKQGTQYILVLPQELIAKTLSIFKKYAVFSDVNIKSSDDCTIIGFIDTDYQTVQNLINHRALLFPLPNNRFEVIVDDDNGINCDFPTTPLPKAYYDIQNNIPEVFVSTSELFFPHFLNLNAIDAVSYDKGCYLGQEVISRMQYRSKNLKTLKFAKVVTEGLAPSQQIIIEDYKGIVVNCCAVAGECYTLYI